MMNSPTEFETSPPRTPRLWMCTYTVTGEQQAHQSQGVEACRHLHPQGTFLNLHSIQSADFPLQARFLRYLDLSENSIDRRAAEYLVQAITPSSALPPSIDSLPLASVSSTQSSATSVPVTPASSSDPNVPNSERPFYESDEANNLEPLFTVAPLLRDDPSVDAGTVLSIRLENCGLKTQALEALGESSSNMLDVPGLTPPLQLMASAHRS
jgi:hypothetical protein